MPGLVPGIRVYASALCAVRRHQYGQGVKRGELFMAFPGRDEALVRLRSALSVTTRELWYRPKFLHHFC
jgi:hypothetical protein